MAVKIPEHDSRFATLRGLIDCGRLDPASPDIAATVADADTRPVVIMAARVSDASTKAFREHLETAQGSFEFDPAVRISRAVGFDAYSRGTDSNALRADLHIEALCDGRRYMGVRFEIGRVRFLWVWDSATRLDPITAENPFTRLLMAEIEGLESADPHAPADVRPAVWSTAFDRQFREVEHAISIWKVGEIVRVTFSNGYDNPIDTAAGATHFKQFLAAAGAASDERVQGTKRRLSGTMNYLRRGEWPYPHGVPIGVRKSDDGSHVVVADPDAESVIVTAHKLLIDKRLSWEQIAQHLSDKYEIRSTDPKTYGQLITDLNYPGSAIARMFKPAVLRWWKTGIYVHRQENTKLRNEWNFAGGHEMQPRWPGDIFGFKDFQMPWPVLDAVRALDWQAVLDRRWPNHDSRREGQRPTIADRRVWPLSGYYWEDLNCEWHLTARSGGRYEIWRRKLGSEGAMTRPRCEVPSSFPAAAMHEPIATSIMETLGRAVADGTTPGALPMTVLGRDRDKDAVRARIDRLESDRSKAELAAKGYGREAAIALGEADGDETNADYTAAKDLKREDALAPTSSSARSTSCGPISTRHTARKRRSICPILGKSRRSSLPSTLRYRRRILSAPRRRSSTNCA